MFKNRVVVAGVVALGLAWAPTGVLAAEPHAHAASVEIKLNNGEKWPTDEALRRGMGEIRNAMAGALDSIHENRLPAEGFEALAARVQMAVDDVTANCKLPEDADAQLHVVLEQILDGIAAMKATAGRAEGAVRIVRALDLYGTHFVHAGWQPLAH